MDKYKELEHARYMVNTEKNISSANKWFDKMVELEQEIDMEREEYYDDLNEQLYEEHCEEERERHCNELIELIEKTEDEDQLKIFIEAYNSASCSDYKGKK